MDGHALINQDQGEVARLCEILHLQDYDRFTRKLESLIGKASDFSQLFMKLRL